MKDPTTMTDAERAQHYYERCGEYAAAALKADDQIAALSARADAAEAEAGRIRRLLSMAKNHMTGDNWSCNNVRNQIAAAISPIHVESVAEPECMCRALGVGDLVAGACARMPDVVCTCGYAAKAGMLCTKCGRQQPDARDAEIGKLRTIIAAYQKARAVNGLCGRGWSSGPHMDAELELHRLGEPGSTQWHLDAVQAECGGGA